jgi:hypothetical protein
MNDVLRAFMLARLAEVVKGQAVYAPPPEGEGEPLSAEEKRFFEFLEWLGRQELSEEAKAHFLMRYMEREKEWRG